MLLQPTKTICGGTDKNIHLCKMHRASTVYFHHVDPIGKKKSANYVGVCGLTMHAVRKCEL